MESDDKVIDMTKYKPSIKNSPLISGDAVEVKDYSLTLGNNQVNTSPPPPPSGGQFNENVSTPPPPTPPSDNYQENMPDDDDIDPMAYNEKPEQPVDEPNPKKEKEDEQVASSSADMLIGLYSGFVPPLLADVAKTDISKVTAVLRENKQIPIEQIKNIEQFLKANNSDIEQALQLTPVQVEMLKDALSKVLRQYNLQPTNPIINLIMVIATIAVMQYMTVSRLIKKREEELLQIIQQFRVTVPEGMEVPFKKKKIFVKKNKEENEQEMEAAA